MAPHVICDDFFRLIVPAVACTASHKASASRRRRFIRHSSRLSGSRSRCASLANRLDIRYVFEVMINRRIFLTLQPCATNSVASQSSSFGCDRSGARRSCKEAKAETTIRMDLVSGWPEAVFVAARRSAQPTISALERAKNVQKLQNVAVERDKLRQEKLDLQLQIRVIDLLPRFAIPMEKFLRENGYRIKHSVLMLYF